MGATHAFLARSELELPSTPVLVLLAGLATHFLCSRFEPWPHQLALPAVCATAALFYSQLVLRDGSIVAATLHTSSILALYASVLLASIAVYRLYFHRLRRFPGTPSMALSKWTLLSTDVQGFRYRLVDELHAQHGCIVRTGPRELSINDAGAIPSIYAAKSPCTKGPWYRGIAGDRPVDEQSTYDTRDKHTHAHRRKLWNAALSSKARTGHVETISQLVYKTIAQLQARASSAPDVDVGEWCDMLSFDCMCEIGFSRRLDLIERGKRSRELVHLQEAVAAAQVIGNVPYLSKALEWLPGNKIGLFKGWVAGVVAERADEVGITGAAPSVAGDKSADPEALHSEPLSPPSTPATEKQCSDVMGTLLRADNDFSLHRRRQIVAEGMLLAVGGSDTTSAALTMALYLLTQHPQVADDVRSEVASALAAARPADALAEAAVLKDSCPLLNAVINETLRLYPPGLSGLQRETPKEGLALTVEGSPVWIPGNVVVTVPPYSVHRDPRHFSPAPHAFRPERWLRPEQEEHMNASGAFMPFGYGPTSCAGREVAYVEMRLFLARLLQAFELRFADTFDAAAFEHGLRDLFTLHIKVPLQLHLSARPAQTV
jgi:cytochrome P450